MGALLEPSWTPSHRFQKCRCSASAPPLFAKETRESVDNAISVLTILTLSMTIMKSL